MTCSLELQLEEECWVSRLPFWAWEKVLSISAERKETGLLSSQKGPKTTLKGVFIHPVYWEVALL